MLIRHDLRLVFLHVPKCAGKQLRSILKETAPAGSLRELWNYSHSTILRRYVDLAHLPLHDLLAFPEFSYLDHYQVIACCRNPYARLSSAVNEFYRQRSQEEELIANTNRLTNEMKEQYYDQLSIRHSQLDPRFIHSLPIHTFTHLGEEPKVDFLLRCETLRRDFLALAKQLNWPSELREQAAQKLHDSDEATTPTVYSTREVELANYLYQTDFATFGYPLHGAPKDQNKRPISAATEVPCLHQAESVIWHWGPTAAKSSNNALRPSR